MNINLQIVTSIIFIILGIIIFLWLFFKLRSLSKLKNSKGFSLFAKAFLLAATVLGISIISSALDIIDVMLFNQDSDLIYYSVYIIDILTNLLILLILLFFINGVKNLELETKSS